MKTKYIAVPISERLPTKDRNGLYFHCEVIGEDDLIEVQFYNNQFEPQYEDIIISWLESVPDHSEEMLSLLEDVNKLDKSMFSDKFNTDDFKRKLNRLINKVKDNGKYTNPDDGLCC